MTDREMLELAAKAAGGMRIRFSNGGSCSYDDGEYWRAWNPLANDGDALRLAVKLDMDILQRFVGGRRAECLAPGGNVIAEHFNNDRDPYSATRRAIVRAAAEIGKAMP